MGSGHKIQINNPWKSLTVMLTALSAGLGIIVAMMAVTGAKGCDGYMSEANAREVHKKNDEEHKILRKVDRETLKLLHKTAEAVGRIDERTKTQ